MNDTRSLLHAVFFITLASGGSVGCASSHAMDAPGDGGPGDPNFLDAPIWEDTGGEPCGLTTCSTSEFCCRAEPGGVCIARGLGCLDPSEWLDAGAPGRWCGAGFPPCSGDAYCAYPVSAACGLGGEMGSCAPRASDCAESGMQVCGCDGRTYADRCDAIRAGTDVGYIGACGADTQQASAARNCGPANGPAWNFVVTDDAPRCGGVGGRSALTIEVWREQPTLGTVLVIGGDAPDGQATYCAGGSGTRCLTLAGRVVFESFDADHTARFSYDLETPDGVRFRSPRMSVSTWCAGTPVC